MVPPGADAIVRTTLDPRLQTVAEQRLTALLDGPGAKANVGQGAVVVLDAASGAVRAMVGGRDWHDGPYNRAVVARRQPGSSFKPFVWLAALEKGARPDDTISSSPIRVGGYSPSNDEPGVSGDVTLEDALARSLNTVSVRLLLQAGGPQAVAAVAHRLGIADALPDNASLALGTGEVGVLEMAAAYASFFNGGFQVAPAAMETLEADHRPIALPHPAPTRVMDADLAGMMVRMMGAVVSRGTGRAAAVPGRAVAGKTGTTQDFRDACSSARSVPTSSPCGWAMTMTSRLRNVAGGSLPARLFHDIAVEVR